MKLFLLLAFVIAVGFIIVDLLIEAASLRPIERREDGLPPGSSPSQTNAIYSTSYTNGQIVSVITNAEYFVEGDIEASPDLGGWETFTHFSFWIPEQLGAGAEFTWEDGPVTGKVTFTVTDNPEPASTISVHSNRAMDPDSPPGRFYRVANLFAWRHEFYQTIIAQQSPYQ